MVAGGDEGAESALRGATPVRPFLYHMKDHTRRYGALRRVRPAGREAHHPILRALVTVAHSGPGYQASLPFAGRLPGPFTCPYRLPTCTHAACRAVGIAVPESGRLLARFLVITDSTGRRRACQAQITVVGGEG